MAARGHSSVFARCPAASVPHSWRSPESPWRKSKVKMAKKHATNLRQPRMPQMPGTVEKTKQTLLLGIAKVKRLQGGAGIVL